MKNNYPDIGEEYAEVFQLKQMSRKILEKKFNSRNLKGTLMQI